MNQINDTPPEVIYLQWADHDTDVGATWCEHKINDDDVAYVAREKYDAAIVRAERAEAALAEAVRLLEILGVPQIPDDAREILEARKGGEG